MPDSPIQVFLHRSWESLGKIVKVGSDYPEPHPEHCAMYNALVGLLNDRSTFHAAEDEAVKLPGDALRLVRALDMRIDDAREELCRTGKVHVTSATVQDAIRAFDDLRPFATLTPGVNSHPKHRGRTQKRGRKPIGKLRTAIKEMIDNREVQKHNRSWKELRRVYQEKLPKNTTADSLRKAVEREEKRRLRRTQLEA